MSANNPLAGQPLNQEDAYRLGHRPLGTGGQAVVFPAEHKVTGVKVALKRLRSMSVEAVARMHREIDFGLRYSGLDHVMPMFDHGLGHDWFVMPLASGNAEDSRAALREDGALADLVFAVCTALEAVHVQGWLHRDLKPANILLLEGRWVVADWGLGRRPRGDTTFTGRTQAGEAFGTEGFAAPEQAVDAHEANPSADVYSLGQIIGWAKTGRTPKGRVPVMPEEEPWRSIVEAATRKDPRARPQDARELRQLLELRLRRG